MFSENYSKDNVAWVPCGVFLWHSTSHYAPITNSRHMLGTSHIKNLKLILLDMCSPTFVRSLFNECLLRLLSQHPQAHRADACQAARLQEEGKDLKEKIQKQQINLT